MATGYGPQMGFRYGIMGLVLGLSLMQVDLKAHHRDEPSKKAAKPASDKKPWWQRLLPLGKAKGKENEGTQALSQSVQQRWTGPDLTPAFDRIGKEAQPVGAPPILSEPVVEKPVEPVVEPAQKVAENPAEKPAKKERRQILGQKSRKKRDEAKAAVPADPAPEQPATPVVDEKAKKKAERDARWAEKRARRKAEKAPRPDSAARDGSPESLDPAPAAVEEKVAPAAPEEPDDRAEAVAPPAQVPAIESDPAQGEGVKADPAGLYVRPDPRLALKIKELQAKKRQMLMDGGSTYQIRKVDAVIAEIRRTGTLPDGL